jgi:hypothetical protein
MIEPFMLKFIEKLVSLEKLTGSYVSYRIMPPISTPFADIVSIQNEARKIAEYIGLSAYTFIITFAKQKRGVGGHIDLSTGGRDVFIEIDPEAMRFPASIGPTICHEICHKWLQVKGINSPILADNEILTDITTIFLGFGKIMLNGCRVENVQEERIGGRTKSSVETRSTGYLDRSQLALVYRLVCAMRKIPRSEYMSGLNPDASNAIEECDNLYKYYFSGKSSDPETVNEIVKAFKADIRALQRQMANLDKHLNYITQSFCGTIHNRIDEGYKMMEKFSQRAETLAGEINFDPAMDFLRAIEKQGEFEKMTCELDSLGIKVGELLAQSTIIGQHIWNSRNNFPAPTPSMFNIVRCPKDATRLRLPQESANLVVSCPTCGIRFAYDTTCISFKALTPKLSELKPSRLRRFLNRFSFFSRS